MRGRNDQIVGMARESSPLWSIAIFLPLLGLCVWLLRDKDFAITPDMAIGLIVMGIVLAIMHWRFGGRFVRPRWKQIGKVLASLVLTYLTMVWLGPLGLMIPLAHQAIGVIGHIVICRRHDINWWTIQPRNRYVALQEKWARGDFS